MLIWIQWWDDNIDGNSRTFYGAWDPMTNF